MIPDFLTRLDRPERGGVWVDYLRETAAALGVDADALVARERVGPSRRDARRLGRRRRGSHPRGGALPVLPRVGGAAARRGATARRGRDARRSSRPRSASAATGAIARDAGSSTATTRSRSSPTTARSAICSAIACSRSSGRSSRPALGYEVPAAVVEAGLAERWREAVREAESRVQGDRRDLPAAGRATWSRSGTACAT